MASKTMRVLKALLLSKHFWKLLGVVLGTLGVLGGADIADHALGIVCTIWQCSS